MLGDLGNVFVDLGNDVECLIHISELSAQQVKMVTDVVKVGDKVRAQVIKLDPEERKIGLSIRALESKEERDQMEKYMAREELPQSDLGAALAEQLRRRGEGE